MNTTLRELIPDWVGSLSEQLEDALEEREISISQLAGQSGVDGNRIQAFISQTIAELTPAEFNQIETTLDFPDNYFARLKAMYDERRKTRMTISA